MGGKEWSRKIVDKDDGQASSFRAEQNILNQDNIEHEEVDQIVVSESGGLPSTQVKAEVTGISQATTMPTIPDTQLEKCEACGIELAVDETFTEHLV